MDWTLSFYPARACAARGYVIGRLYMRPVLGKPVIKLTDCLVTNVIDRLFGNK